MRSGARDFLQKPKEGLESWLSGQEQRLLLRRTWFLFPAPTTPSLTSVCSSSSPLLDPEGTTYYILVYLWYTEYRQTKHPHTQNKNKPKPSKQGKLVLVVGGG